MLTSLLCAFAVAAAPGNPAPAPSDDAWLSLDREIESLAAAAAPLQGEEKGFEVSAWIKTSYDHSSDAPFQADPVEDVNLSGFDFEGIRLNFKGEVEGYEVKISIDGKDGAVKLKDGYVRFDVTDAIHAQLGQFKSRFLFSSYASDEKLVMYRRSLLGGSFSERDPGLQLDGKFGPFIAILQAQNGNDGVGDHMAVTAKAIWAAIGKAIEKQSGGYGPDADTALTFGLGYYDDSSVSDGTALSAEAELATGPFWASAEVVDVGDDFVDIDAGPAKKAGANGIAGGTPWAVTGAWMFDPRFELVGRFQDYDDDENTTSVLGGVNYYVNGHATKWQLNYEMRDSDSTDLDGDRLTLGLVVIV